MEGLGRVGWGRDFVVVGGGSERSAWRVTVPAGVSSLLGVDALSLESVALQSQMNSDKSQYPGNSQKCAGFPLYPSQSLPITDLASIGRKSVQIMVCLLCKLVCLLLKFYKGCLSTPDSHCPRNSTLSDIHCDHEIILKPESI